MQSIFQIFQINSNEDIISFSRKEDFEVKYVGNGFFVTKDGYLTTVAHVFKNEGIRYYALISNNFFKIGIIHLEFTERNETHRDIAIGKINIEQNTDFIDINNSDDVSLDNITIKGYFRSSKNKELIPKYIELPTICLDSTHYSKPELHKHLHNYFSFVIDGESLYGMSGSPIFNKQNKIVGIVKGGNEIIGHAMHVRVLIEILNRWKI